MKTAIVTFDNQDTITTGINGTDEEIRGYYGIGKAFNLGDGENDLMVKVVSLQIIPALPPGFIHEGKRVYYMDKHGKDISFPRWRVVLYYASHLAMTHFLPSQADYDEFLSTHAKYCYSSYDEFRESIS